MNPKLASIAISILTAAGAIWARFVVVEQRQENMLQAIASLNMATEKFETRVRSLERDREMLERVQALEVRLVRIEERQAEQERRRR